MLLKIRLFKEGSDEEAFVKIFNASFSDYEDIRKMTLNEMAALKQSPNFNAKGLFFAEWNGQIAGMVHTYVNKIREEYVGFIDWIGVLPEFRKKDIGTELLGTAVQCLKKQNVKIAETWGQTDREGCMRLFDKFGFKPAKTTNIMKRTLRDIPPLEDTYSQVTVRQARLNEDKDIAIINRLDNEAFKEHPDYRPRSFEETKYMLVTMPWFKVSQAFLAIFEDQPIGYIVAGIDNELNDEKNVRYGWILDIGVLKTHRGKSVGSKLMAHGMAFLREQGMTEALLYVEEANPTAAIRLYKNLGFKITKQTIIFQRIMS